MTVFECNSFVRALFLSFAIADLDEASARSALDAALALDAEEEQVERNLLGEYESPMQSSR
eukprot:6302517-Amphidinium_carterae.1